MSRPFATHSVLKTWTLAFAGLAGAVLLAPSAASAAECVNGYQTLRNQIILPCDSQNSVASFGDVRGTTPRAPAPTAAVPTQGLIAKSPADCHPGQYWGFEMVESGDLLLAC